MRPASPPHSRSRSSRYLVRLSARGLATTNRCCSQPIAPSPARRAKGAPSRRPPSGCSTTTISWKSKSARSARTCRRASIGSCPSWRADRSSVTHACSASPGRSLPTPTATSIPKPLRRFVRAYQSVQPLTIGELWAVAITLRIVLVENLRRAAHRIVSSRAARQEADALADRLLGVNGHAAEPDALMRATHDASPSRRHLWSSSCSGCAIRTRESLRHCTGWRSAWPRREAQPTRSCATSTSGKAARTSRCATSSRACG